MRYFLYKLRAGQKEALELIEENISHKNICLNATTGFGKTPVILSALLTKAYPKGYPIIWSVRTGNETDRPIEELKNIANKKKLQIFGLSYRGKKDMCLLAEELKINDYEEVSFLCKTKLKKCKYAKKFENFNFDLEALVNKPLLYSEIMKYCKSKKICPYLVERVLLPCAQVVALSYNYIVNDKTAWSIRKLIPFEYSYLVVDEAHNLQHLSLNSDKISLGTFQRALKELGMFERKEVEELEKFIKIILERATKIYNQLENANGKERELDILEFLKGVKNVEYNLSTIRKYGERIRKFKLDNNKAPRSSLYHLANFWLSSITLVGVDGIAFIATRTGKNLELERWDMRAKEALKETWQNFRANVFCSGTLAPLDGFAETIGLENWLGKNLCLDYDRNKVRTLIVEGLTTKGERLLKNMALKYIESLEDFLALNTNLAIFSSSYRVQNTLLHNNLEQIAEGARKKIFIEKQGMRGDDARKILDEFKACAYKEQKALLVASAQGRFAEGADFPGKELEGIFLAGIPFEKMTLRTKLYLMYYEKLYGKKKGNYYAYVVPALRRASQALGRALRSKQDRA
ncbi:MAG: helicase C-terminal domain-containing protein, partial [Candidatus Thermoplasmatota archaeon]